MVGLSRCHTSCSVVTNCIPWRTNVNMCVSLPVLRVMSPHSGAHRGPDDNQQLPQPYWGKHSPVAPLDDSVESQGEQHREQQQAGIDQELTVTEKRKNRNENWWIISKHFLLHLYINTEMVLPTDLNTNLLITEINQ